MPAKPMVVVLTSLGRLFVADGSKLKADAHACEMAGVYAASPESLVLRFLDKRPQWTIETSAEAALELQIMLWVVHSTANSSISLDTNLKNLPLHLLPPLSKEGNLHTCFVMQSNAAGVTEPEDVLRRADPVVRPALRCT